MGLRGRVLDMGNGIIGLCVGIGSGFGLSLWKKMTDDGIGVGIEVEVDGGRTEVVFDGNRKRRRCFLFRSGLLIFDLE